MTTVNNGIPFVPENTIDPAAGLNLSLNTIDALLQILVQTVGANTPPASPTNGARYIVGAAPTTAWSGQANKLARWLDGAWQFFDARYALNAADGQWYGRSGATWAQLGGALADGSVTNPKLADMATQTIKGRASVGAGVPEDLTPAQARGVISVREQLAAARTYFVRTDGNDSNDGLANTAGGAFLTIQKAVNVAASLDLSIFNCTIEIADGTYTGAVVLKAASGDGQVRIIGNEATPANVIITGGGNLVSGVDFGRYLLAGVTLASTGVRNIQVSGRSQLQIKNIVSQGSPSLNTHAAAINYAEVQAVGPITVNGNSAIGFLGASFALMNIRGSSITFAPGAVISARGFQGSDQGRVDMVSVTFNGSFTGPRYQVAGLGAIFTNGAGETFIPGTAAGTTATGGIYY
jgi:hypothetical protein